MLAVTQLTHSQKQEVVLDHSMQYDGILCGPLATRTEKQKENIFKSHFICNLY
jgi:hypothetical protein